MTAEDHGQFLRQAVDYYHQLLLDKTLSAAAVRGDLAARMREKQLCFGDRLLCPFFRPHFVTRSLYRDLNRIIKLLAGAVDNVCDLLLADSTQIRRMGLTGAEQELALVDPGFPDIHVTTRFDSFSEPGSIQFVEYNAECPAGIAYAEGLADLFSQLEIMRRFSARYPCWQPRPRRRLVDTLLSTFRRWGGRGSPRIAIVDWKDVPTRAEQELFLRDFQARGYRAVLADPYSLEYRDGTLWAEGERVDLVYRRLLVHEFLARFDTTHPLARAYKDGAVCVVNSFRSKLAHKKMLFAFLTDPEIQNRFSGDQRKAIGRHIPWTRRLEETRADYHGERVDLVSFLLANRDRMVIKPNDDYGGKGIVVGWECTDAEWENALRAALATSSDNGASYVAQEKVRVCKEKFPRWDQDLQFQEVLVDMDPFIFGGEVEGALTRLSETSLCNVTSGGGQVPMFVLED
ncbi:MAG TPA: circularly permuted type 2 ATP-grasp protein [Acidobacteriota bacterium]|jgi:uncharacterized circularly permuted ATP-grasp superfamily protein|nr:circularly permuted type 2 ATP-grasp protein [Acidobacteriota bacterium]